GLDGGRLVDGLSEPTWRAPANWWPGGMYNQDYWTKYPQEIVFSFYERKPALVGALTFVLPDAPTVAVENDPSTAPADIEVWTSMDSVSKGFSRIAAAKLEPKGGEQTVTFPATEARFVKLRLLSGATARVVEIAELRMLESVREGYEPLFSREPGTKLWKGSPREAAQRGLYWLQQASTDWNFGKDGCFGCHVHAQALMGQTVALRESYRVSIPAMQALANHIRTHQTPEGTFFVQHEIVAAAYGAMGLARADEATGSTQDRELRKAVDYLIAAQQDDGSFPWGNQDPPIIQGPFVLLADALEGMQWVAANSSDPKYGRAAGRALAWIAANEPVTAQDQVFKIFTINRYGTPEQKRAAWPLVEALAAQQQPDGGWKEIPAMEGSNGYATGQVLYAFKQAGVSVRSEMFRRGVDYLLKTQSNEQSPAIGSWKAVHTQSQRKSDFAPTMWAVIGLAGAYGAEPKGALQVTRGGNKPATPNLEIVLDVSGSMNTKLGDSTRWQVALATLKEVVSTLPDDLNVGLRVYGHRYSSKSAETCQDTELLVPIAKLDREKILNAATGLKPRGETPLVRSVLKTVGDLKAGGGGSVILITDGEESCQGNAKSAAKEIAKSGVNVTLNIVGFTLTGKNVEAELGTFAGATGGQYYGAQNGAQLSRAIKMAAAQRLPYDILDSNGKVVASGETSGLSRELLSGNYRIRIDALGQKLEDSVTIVADQTTTIGIAVEGDQFVIQH
ncbi:MAG: VWA domain-containing protein, partial [Steroidobacteraceae bacterium]